MGDAFNDGNLGTGFRSRTADMTSQNLRYDSISDQTRARWDKVLASARRDLTERMRRLIGIALDACDSIGPAKMESRLHNGSLWFLCPQADLAELLGCSDRTLRTEFDRLEACGCLLKYPHQQIENLIAYRLPLAALESLPESLTPRLDEIICFVTELELESAAVVDSVTDSGDCAGGVADAISGPISGGISGPVSGPISGGVSVPMVMTMKQEHENNTHGHDHGVLKKSVVESQTQALKSGRVKFKNIQPEHITRIVHRLDVDLFQSFFEDLVERRWAKNCESDRVRLAATFHYVARQDSETPGKLATWAWKNREAKKADKSPLVPLTDSDDQFARTLFRPKAATKSETAVAIVNPLRQLDDRGPGELSPEEIHRQRMFRASNVAALAGMQK
jgi:hypothetical protein